MTGQKKKIKEYKLVKLIPSFVTIGGICAGLSGIRFALDEKWELAVLMIIAASLIDAIDGKFARALDATTEFGSQLDSLSDFINFGFVPVFVLFLWSMHEVPRLGWAAVLFFTVCCAIRLARFNAELENEEEEQPEWKEGFFIGVPSPAGALGCMGPMIFTFGLSDFFGDVTGIDSLFNNPYFLIFYSSFFGFLMASNVPTYSIKRKNVRKDFVSIIFIVVAALFAALIIQPWFTVIFIGIIYYGILLPVSSIHYLKLSRNDEYN